MARKIDLENYVPVPVRIAKFRSDHKTGSIETVSQLIIEGDNAVASFKATIKDSEGKVLGTGHSFCSELEEQKEFEKAETAAIGRALAHSGYSAEVEGAGSGSDDEEEEEESSSKKKKKKGLGGLGSKKKSKAKDEEEEDEEESEEDETEEEESEEEEAEDEESEDDEEDSEEDEEEDDEEERPKKNSSALDKILKKHGLKKK